MSRKRGGRRQWKFPDRLDALIKAEWKCEWCGATGNLTYDHIVAVVNGGKNHGGNLQILCFDCNQKKGDLIAEEAEYVKRMVQGRNK